MSCLLMSGSLFAQSHPLAPKYAERTKADTVVTRIVTLTDDSTPTERSSIPFINAAQTA